METIEKPDARAARPWNRPSIRRVPTGRPCVTLRPISDDDNEHQWIFSTDRMFVERDWNLLRTMNAHHSIQLLKESAAVQSSVVSKIPT